jgi:hypothetical protein
MTRFRTLGIGAALVAASFAAHLLAQAPVATLTVAGIDGSALGCYVKAGTGTLADTTNHANCKASAGNLYGVRAVNTSATIAYLRLYNLATDATCTSATGFVESIPIPALATAYALVDTGSVPIGYAVGIAYCVTGAGASTDNSAPPAGVYITLKVK